MVCPELTEQIRREIAASLHQRKGDFACYFLTDLVTFTLPAGNPDIYYESTLCFLKVTFLCGVKIQYKTYKKKASKLGVLGFFILCVWMFCLHVYLCPICVPGTHGGQKRVSDPWEAIVNWVLWKSSQCF
jgi:hypothetical protein